MNVLLGLAIGLVLPPGSQTLRSAEKFGELTRADARRLGATFFKQSPSTPEATHTVELYRVRYWSTGLKGERTLLSGLVALPITSTKKGLVVFMHGTTVIRTNVPSYMTLDGSTAPEALVAVLTFASGGYALAAPDYLGQGDSEGGHPYAMGTLNAASGIDLIKAARQLAESKNRRVPKDVFVTGYSEGGANAMWLARKLMEGAEPSIQVAKAAPVSGPYDLTGAQAKAMLARQTSLTDVAARLFFLAYMGYSMVQCFGGPPLDSIFTPSFASYVPVVFRRDLATDDEYAKQLMGKGLQLGTLVSVGRILTPSFKDALATVDRKNAAVEILAANDCTDWSPTRPTLLVGLTSDNMVVYQNTRNALAKMRTRGVGPDLVNACGIRTKGLDHITAMPVLMTYVRKFFDEGFDAVPKD